MPRSTPQWGYGNTPGHWIDKPSVELRNAVENACKGLPAGTVAKLVERCAVLGSALRVYEDEQSAAPTCGAEAEAAKRIAAEASALAEKLPNMGGIRAEVQARMLDAGEPAIDLQRLRGELERISEAAAAVNIDLCDLPKADKRRRSPEQTIALKLASDYERITGEKATRWAAASRGEQVSASLYVRLLWLLINEYGARARTLSAVDRIAQTIWAER